MRIAIVRVLLTSLFLLTIYNEYIIYVLKPLTTWPEIACRQNEVCTRILVVADPQILGEWTESIFARFDSDRYLRNTFSVAMNYVKPDGVIFLGDLLDEGSLASEAQFARYYNRFQSTFGLQKLGESNIPVVIVPGDNDIGGEAHEVIKAENVRRFRRYYGKDEAVVVKNIRIFKVNKLLRTYPVMEERFSREKSMLNIAVSHMPLTIHAGMFTDQIVRDIKPEFIFSAHKHQSYALLTLKENGKQLYYEELKYNAFKNGVSSWSFQTANTTNYTIITEISVPTCSYRMGVTDMGYGVIVHGKKSTEIIYHVLWLPSRFTNLSLYAMFFLLCALIGWINSSHFRRTCVKRRFHTR